MSRTIIRNGIVFTGTEVFSPATVVVDDGRILQILEGSLCLVDCVDDPSFCERSSFCISRDIWREASKNLQQTLENMTLAAMVSRQKEKRQDETGR